MKKYFKILRECTLFDNISDENLIHLLNCLNAKVESFDKKCTIIAEGTPAKYIGVLLSGSAQMIKIDYFGNRNIVLNVASKEVFGEAFACAGVRAIPISIIANEPCEIMLINCNRIMQPCAKACGFHQQMIYNLMKDLAIKNIIFHQKAEITSKRTTREKLLAYLMLQAKNQKSNRFDIPFDRQELADYLEVDRSGLSAEISKLRKEGVLTSRKKHFELL